MRVSRILTAVAVVGTLALAGCSSSTPSSSASSTAGAPAKVTDVRVALNNTSDSLPIVVAQKEGFFEKAGLNVTTTTLADITVVPSLLGSQYDVGFTVAPILIRAASSGLPVVMISGNNGDSPEDQPVQIYVRKGITSVKELAGKRIGSPTLTGNINTATKAWLSKNGVDPNGVQFVQVPTPNMVDQLNAGQVDAVEIIYPFINLAKSAGLKTLGDPERVLSKGYVGGTYWAASTDWTSKNPAAVKAFRGALDQADQWIAKNPTKAYQVAADYTKVPVAQAKKSPLGDYTTTVSAADLKIWGDAMKKYAGFTGTIDYAALVDTGK
jgi:NitT/TauT family transport system substrate-binding protein